MWWELWMEESITKGISREDCISRQAICLSSPLGWNYPCSLPSGGFLRTNIHPGVSEATHCPALTAWSGIGQPQTQRPNRTCSCCLRASSFPADYYGVGKQSCKTVNSWAHEAQWIQHVLSGQIKGHTETSALFSAVTHCLPQMFWIWSRNQQRPKTLTDSKMVN